MFRKYFLTSLVHRYFALRRYNIHIIEPTNNCQHYPAGWILSAAETRDEGYCYCEPFAKEYQRVEMNGGVTYFIVAVFVLSLSVRIVFIFAGSRYFDHSTGFPRYTDVDYGVFNEAAMFIRNRQSPYEKFTYRYPPEIAWILTSNEYLPEFGKIMFALADSLIASLIYLICRLRNRCGANCDDDKQARVLAFAWCLNPLAINISTRGSWDSVTNLLLLLVLYYTISSKLMVSGCLYGTLIHLRVYPIVYIFGFFAYIMTNNTKEHTTADSERVESGCDGDNRRSGSRLPTIVHTIGSGIAKKWKDVLIFSVSTASSLVLLTVACYQAYGGTYLRESIFYHITRQDHRHNFSPCFYGIYLSKSDALGGVGYDQKGDDADIPQTIASYRYLLTQLAPQIASFLPQIVLMLILALLVAPRNIELWLLVQTLSFVTFNKVVTAQYFTWYACLIPIAWPSLQRVPWQILTLSCVTWVLTLSVWLWRAYLLEFEGMNTFLSVWISSIAFHVVNVGIVIMLLLYGLKTT